MSSPSHAGYARRSARKLAEGPSSPSVFCAARDVVGGRSGARMVLDHPSLHGARALVADNKLKVWLDIDINGSRAAYQRAVDFVAARNLYVHAAPHCA